MAASRDRFLEIDLAGPTGVTSPTLWDRIEASLAAPSADAIPVSPDAPIAANDNLLIRWKRAAAAGLAASLMLAAALGYMIVAQPEPKVVAVLLDDKGAPMVIVEDFGDASARITPLADYAVPAGRAMQVWTLPNKDMGPTSLGLLDAWRTATLRSEALPQPHEEQLYEITLEPPGGSPTGKPTGPILVKGFAKIPR